MLLLFSTFVMESISQNRLAVLLNGFPLSIMDTRFSYCTNTAQHREKLHETAK
jgi:hypothetical protein